VLSPKHLELEPKAVPEVILKQELYFSTSFSMSQQVYDWKRFWCPRSSQINPGDRGYLTDPESEDGKYANPELVGFESIADIPCLVLLGEPGIGKSQELGNLKEYTRTKLESGHKVFELNLRSCTSLREDLFQDEQFVAWKDGTYRLYLFLDSLDEGLLQIQTLATQLVDTFKQDQYRDKLSRLYIRIACRTAVFPNILEEGLKELWEESNVGIYELAPLRRVDIQASVTAHGLDAETFLNEVERKSVVPFAIKPITLKFLLNTFQKNNGQFPPDQTLVNLYLDGCRSLCEEQNQSRHASRRIGRLDVTQRLIVTARIAAVTVFANRFAVWTEPNSGNVPGEDVLLEELCLGDEVANERRFPVTRDAIEEALDTGLFSSRGSSSRMGWAHQTYAEFLAAWYLAQNQVSLAQIQTLIFSSEDPEHRLIPQLHETAAWLASMRVDVFQDIIKTDPDILLQSDISTDPNLRKQIVSCLLIQFELEQIYELDANIYRGYGKLKHPELAEQLRPYINDCNQQSNARNAAILIAEVCKENELQDELTILALDSSQPICLRASAAHALCSLGNADARLRLKPLIVTTIPEDKNDELKGYALEALWSEILNVEELFQSLTNPKRNNFYGSYQLFLNYKLTPKLHHDDLLVALKWIESQGVRCFGHPFEELGNSILLRAWEYFNLNDVSKNFAKAAFVQRRRHKKIITCNSDHQKNFEESLSNDHNKRRILIEQMISLILESSEDILILFSGGITERLLFSIDIFWMLEKLRCTDSQEESQIWAHLIQRVFDHQDREQIDALITATQTDKVLKEKFLSFFEAVELNSANAKKMEAEYIEMQKWNGEQHAPPLLLPSPQERILKLLCQLESGDLSAWWKLNLEMTLKHDSQFYDNEFEWDLTKLPGWQDADEGTQRRIINGAKKYLQQGNELSYDWIGGNQITLDRPAMGGCRALLILLKMGPGFLDSLSSEVWSRWTPAIIASPCNNYHEYEYLEIVKLSYLNAPDQAINTLMTLIERENHDYISAIDRFERCWDSRLKNALLEKIKDGSLKSQLMSQLLEELLRHQCIDAKEFAQSLISEDLIEEEHERTLIAAKALIKNSNSSTWSFIWSFIFINNSFGRAVFERIAQFHSSNILFDLTETQLADLYLWLVQEYPHNEDPDHSNEIGSYTITVRDNLAKLRDGVLKQIIEKGTLQSCAEIQRLIKILTHLTWLSSILPDAQKNMRRNTWNPSQPKEILQLAMSQEPFNSIISSQLGTLTNEIKHMSEQPKIDLSNSKIDGSIAINTGKHGNIEQKIELKDKKEINWSAWIAILIALLAIAASASISGLFNDEVKQWLFNRSPSPEMHKKPSDVSNQKSP
jgi:predicted NACHT family NTPase